MKQAEFTVSPWLLAFMACVGTAFWVLVFLWVKAAMRALT
jgi:hypothetical protein